MFTMPEIFCIVACPFSGWAAWFGERKEAIGGAVSNKKKMTLLLVGIAGFLEHGTYGAKMAYEKWNALGTEEEYGGTILLAVCIFLLFIGWQNFYKENGGNPDNGKNWERLFYADLCILHYAVLQALSQVL